MRERWEESTVVPMINKRVETGPGSNKPVAPISRLLFRSSLRGENLSQREHFGGWMFKEQRISRTRAMYGSADVVGAVCRSTDGHT